MEKCCQRISKKKKKNTEDERHNSYFIKQLHISQSKNRDYEKKISFLKSENEKAISQIYTMKSFIETQKQLKDEQNHAIRTLLEENKNLRSNIASFQETEERLIIENDDLKSSYSVLNEEDFGEYRKQNHNGFEDRNQDGNKDGNKEELNRGISTCESEMSFLENEFGDEIISDEDIFMSLNVDVDDATC